MPTAAEGASEEGRRYLNRLVALDVETGEEVWRSRAVDRDVLSKMNTVTRETKALFAVQVEGLRDPGTAAASENWGFDYSHPTDPVVLEFDGATGKFVGAYQIQARMKSDGLEQVVRGSPIDSWYKGSANQRVVTADALVGSWAHEEFWVIDLEKKGSSRFSVTARVCRCCC